MKDPIKTIGIIIFRLHNKQPKYLLLHHGGKYWNFPKGRQEPGESEMQTAFREVWEETGILINNIKLLPGFRQHYDYHFKSKYQEDFGQKVKKQAIFYLGEVKNAKVKISEEHDGFRWFTYGQALKKLYFKQSPKGQDLLKNAHDYLLKKNQKNAILNPKILQNLTNKNNDQRKVGTSQGHYQGPV